MACRIMKLFKRIQEQNFTADGQGVALEEKTISNALKEAMTAIKREKRMKSFETCN